MSSSASALKGTIKLYKPEKGFGFIKPDDGSDDIFFHISAVLEGDQGVEKGAGVSYVREKGQKGPRAVNVSVL